MSPASQCQWAWVTSRVGRVLVCITGEADTCTTSVMSGSAVESLAPAQHILENASRCHRGAPLPRDDSRNHGAVWNETDRRWKLPYEAVKGTPGICACFAPSRVDARFSLLWRQSTCRLLPSTGALSLWRAASPTSPHDIYASPTSRRWPRAASSN